MLGSVHGTEWVDSKNLKLSFEYYQYHHEGQTSVITIFFLSDHAPCHQCHLSPFSSFTSSGTNIHISFTCFCVFNTYCHHKKYPLQLSEFSKTSGLSLDTTDILPYPHLPVIMVLHELAVLFFMYTLL